MISLNCVEKKIKDTNEKMFLFEVQKESIWL